jgi:hypothetical protein
MRKSGIFDPRSVGYNSFCNSLGREKPSSLTQLALPISKLHLLSETARHKSTISRELKRNIKSRGWRPLLAHTQAVERRSSKAKKEYLMTAGSLLFTT